MLPLKSMLIPIPPLIEQKQKVEQIEMKFSVCDKLNEAINQSLEKAQALRQSILKKAFEGNFKGFFLRKEFFVFLLEKF